MTMHHHHDFHPHTSGDHNWNHPTDEHSHPDLPHHHHGDDGSTIYQDHGNLNNPPNHVHHVNYRLAADGIDVDFGPADHQHPDDE